MVWLKSTTQKTYSVGGKTVPACVTSDNKYLALSDGDYEAFKANKVVASLIRAGAILVTDKEPSSPTKQVSQLTTQNAQLIRENTELKEELKKRGDTDAITAELATAKEELAQLQVKYSELEKEAKETIADLKKQLKAAKA